MRTGLIKRFRPLSYLAQPVVELGQVVDEAAIVARIPYLPGRVRRMNAARELGIPKDRVADHLLVPIGVTVPAGSPLAAARRHWRWS
ncbi:MAG: hypothetical protein ACYC6V_03740, partial [Bacillota bacterium]